MQTVITNIDRKYRRKEKTDREIRQIDRIEKIDIQTGHGLFLGLKNIMS